MNSYKKAGLILGPLSYVIILVLSGSTENPELLKVTALASWMLIWWISEAVQLPVTALLPLFILPAMKSTSLAEAATPYSNPIIFLFMGGFIIALAMEKWKLHKRVALSIIKLTGTNANGIILGFMLATALLSMWISNTATTVMMLPIGLSVINLVFNEKQNLNPKEQYFALSLMIGIAFAANIGGTATLVGTPPNVVFAGYFKEHFQQDVSFLNWMLLGVPFSLLLLTITYFLITRVFYPNQLGNMSKSSQVIDEELNKLGTISKNEKRILIVFIATAFLWIFRTLIDDFLPFIYLHDTVIAMFGATILFVLPSAQKDGNILNWNDTSRLPWGILLLFGGGLSLAKALEKVGLIDQVAAYVAGMGQVDVWVLVLILSSLALFLTEVMSNLALIVVFLPMLVGIANGFHINPLFLAIPATLASSCAFMLPMATPPNAIVFASGHIKVSQMVKIGFILNVISIILLVAGFRWIIPYLFS